MPYNFRGEGVNRENIMGPTIIRTIAAASSSRKATHRIIACLCAGAADGIESGALSPREASRDLFTEENYQEIKRHRMNKSLKSCFETGMLLVGMDKHDVAKSLVSMRDMARQVLRSANEH
jgi:hypothetical protein